MRVWDVSIRNPVFISMIMLALIVLGAMAYTGMPLDFFPDVSYPTMAIITVYAGAGPGEIENQVTRPIEEAMVTAPGVEEVQSRSSEGYSVVIVSFNLDKDAKVALQEVREKIANVRSNLPDGVLEPTITAYDPSSLPILRLSVGQSAGPGDRPADVRLTVTEDVLPRLQRIEGVADAVVTGGREREIQVFLDADALKARRVAPAAGDRDHRRRELQHPGRQRRAGRAESPPAHAGQLQDGRRRGQPADRHLARRGARGRYRHGAGRLEGAGYLQPAGWAGSRDRLRPQAVGHEHRAGGRAREEGVGRAWQRTAGSQPGRGPGSVDLRPGELQRRHARAVDRRAGCVAGRVRLLPQPAQHPGDGRRPAHHLAGHLRRHVCARA